MKRLVLVLHTYFTETVNVAAGQLFVYCQKRHLKTSHEAALTPPPPPISLYKSWMCFRSGLWEDKGLLQEHTWKSSGLPQNTRLDLRIFHSNSSVI